MAEVGKLQQRLAKLKQGGSQVAATQTSATEGRAVEATQTASSGSDGAGLSAYQQKIFGFTLFYNKELNFNPSLNIPTPQSYVLGAGDQLLIDIYGASQQSYDLKVSPEGRCWFPMWVPSA